MRIRDLIQTGRKVTIPACGLIVLLTVAMLTACSDRNNVQDALTPSSGFSPTSDESSPVSQEPASSQNTDNIAQPASVMTPAPASSFHRSSEAECWAVVVGIGEYEHLETGPNDRDANEIADEFTSIWGEEHIKVLLNKAATRENIKSALTDWLQPKETEEDIVIFFFAGHGIGNILFPSDSRYDSYKNDIHISMLNRWLSGIDSQSVVLILESCYSGKELPALRKSGRVVVTSASGSEPSWGTTEGLFFPLYLKEVLRKPEIADADQDGRISVEEIYSYVAGKVTLHAGNMGESQHPQIGDDYAGELELFNFRKVTSSSTLSDNSGSKVNRQALSECDA